MCDYRMFSSSFATLTKESNTCASCCANAWIRARQTTDHDLACVIPDKKRNVFSNFYAVDITPSTRHPQSTRRTYFHSSLQHVSCSQCLCSFRLPDTQCCTDRTFIFGSRKRIALHGSGAQDSDGRRKP